MSANPKPTPISQKSGSFLGQNSSTVSPQTNKQVPSQSSQSKPTQTILKSQSIGNIPKVESNTIVKSASSPSFSSNDNTLPPDWTEYKDDGGYSYFYNDKTGVTQWERPSMPKPQETQAPLSPVPQRPNKSLPPPPNKSLPPAPAKSSPQLPPRNPAQIPAKSQNSSPQIPINNTKSNSASNIPRIPPKSPEPVNLHVATSPLTARRTTQSATTSTSVNRPPSLPAPLKTEPPVPLPRTFSPPPVRNNAPVKLPELSKSPPLNRQSAILPASSPSHGSLPNRSSTIIDSNYKKAPALPEKPTTNSSAPVVPPKVFPQKEVVAQGNRPVPVPMKSTGRPPTVVQPQNSPQKTAVVPAKQLPPTPAAKPARVPAKATRSNNLPPAPPPKKPELSALLQNGQQQQGSAAQIGVCPKCNQALFHGEPKVSAKGKMWHKNCFVCNSCNLPFTESFTTVAGNPYHIKCVCAKCKVPFKTGEHKMSAQGMMWHRSCFVCTHCGNPFTSTFTTKNGKVYHVECWVAVSESGQPAPSTPSQQPSQAPVIRESSKFKDVMGKAKEKLGVFGEKAHEKLELFGEKAQELAKEKYAFLKAKRAEQKKKAEENRKISEEQKKLTEQQKEEQRKVQEQQREEQRKVQEAKKEEQRKKAQMKKEQQRKTLEQKKEEKARKQQAKQKDKELRNAKGKQSVAFNGVLVKAVVDQIGSDSDEILTFELDALFHLTDVKFGGDNTNKVGGGTGLFLGYNNGRQGFVPVHCVEVIAPPKVEDYAPLFKNLLQIIVAPDLSIALSLCSVFPREEQTLLSKALVPLFESNGHILDLIEVLIENEIAQTTDPATLFRNNSIASAVMTNYFFAIGKDYLRGILVPLIEEVTKLDYSVELDPAKAGGQDVSQNAANLRLISQKFFDTITGSVSVCPAPIKNICYLLATEVSKKFPQHKHVVVGGFVFLRAFSPAVVSPEGFQLVTELDAKSRRPLVLISKLLQNVSNGKEFKEEYMHSVNSFVSDNLPKAEAFFDQLSATYYDNAVVPKNTPLLDCIDMEALHKFHYQINMHLSKIGKELELMTELTQNLEEYPYDQFLALLHELGPPKGSIPADEKKEEKKKDQAKTNPQEKKPEPLKRSSTEIQRPPPASASSDNHDLVRMFGIPVGECKLDSSQPVPFVLELCINYLESYALREEGILRLAGNNTEVKELRAELERGQTPDFSKCSDIHSVGALLKIFLRELPKPLFQVSKETTRIFYFMYPLISQVVQDSEDMVELLQSDLSDLPEINFQATKRLFGFLKKIVGNAEVNKMSAENIAVVLQPTVHLPHDIIVAMIANYEALFMPASSEETTQNTGNYWEDQSYWSEVQKSVDETFENTEQPEYTFEEAYVEEMTEESGYELSESQEMDTQMEQEEEYQEQEENLKKRRIRSGRSSFCF